MAVKGTKRVSLKEVTYDKLKSMAERDNKDVSAKLEEILGFYTLYNEAIAHLHPLVGDFIVKNPSIMGEYLIVDLLKAYTVAKVLEKEKSFVQCHKKCAQKVLIENFDEDQKQLPLQ